MSLMSWCGEGLADNRAPFLPSRVWHCSVIDGAPPVVQQSGGNGAPVATGATRPTGSRGGTGRRREVAGVVSTDHDESERDRGGVSTPTAASAGSSGLQRGPGRQQVDGVVLEHDSS